MVTRMGNGKTRIERVHTSKKGHTYKRRRSGTLTAVERGAPGWLWNAMMARWFK